MANQKSSQTVALLLRDTGLEIAKGGHGKCFLRPRKNWRTGTVDDVRVAKMSKNIVI